MKKVINISLLFVFLGGMCGCSSPAEVIAGHFSAMNEIAVAHQDNCDDMGNALIQYLDANNNSLKDAVMRSGDTETDKAAEIFRTSTELHLSTEKCHSASVESFRQKLSDIVLLSTTAN